MANSNTSVKPRGDIWFPDGDIIIETSTKQYCLFEEILQLHSSTVDFTKMEPSDDWEVMIRLILGLKGIYEPGAETIAIPVMLAVLRLGAKHGFKEFYDEAVSQVKFILESSGKKTRNIQTPEDWYPLLRGYEFELLETIAGLDDLKYLLPKADALCLSIRTFEDIVGGRDMPGGPVILSDASKQRLLDNHV